MHILIGLTYYRPHYSGLSIYTERLARSLVKLGHEVTVITSRFDRRLPEREVLHGVRIIRPNVLFRLSKGVIMPQMPLWALGLIRSADVVNLHLPQMDAAYLAWMARLMNKPIVTTYHCDLILPKGIIHWVANQGSHLAGHITALASDVIVHNTRDYAEHSPFLHHYLQKLQVVPTPVELAPVSEGDIEEFRHRNQVEPGQRIIGMVARMATEKGVEYLIEALPIILQKHPTARVLFVGQHQNVLGEGQYARKLAPLINQLDHHWSFLGVISPVELAAFFNVCDVTVLPSLNATESFGIVQVEAMSCGTPTVASDLPGVRCAVQETGMGLIVPPRDSQALADAITNVLDAPQRYAGDAAEVRRRYASETVARRYEEIFMELMEKNDPRSI
jgi:glycosyltransferase involved in cell wall biosynthesis